MQTSLFFHHDGPFLQQLHMLLPWFIYSKYIRGILYDFLSVGLGYLHEARKQVRASVDYCSILGGRTSFNAEKRSPGNVPKVVHFWGSRGGVTSTARTNFNSRQESEKLFLPERIPEFLGSWVKRWRLRHVGIHRIRGKRYLAKKKSAFTCVQWPINQSTNQLLNQHMIHTCPAYKITEKSLHWYDTLDWAYWHIRHINTRTWN